MAVLACLLSGACASSPEAKQNAAEGNAGGEAAGSRYRELESDPNWDSAEEADEQLEGD